VVKDMGTNQHRKKKKTWLSPGVKTALITLIGGLFFFVILRQLWSC
jgi:hypothetical protein